MQRMSMTMTFKLKKCYSDKHNSIKTQTQDYDTITVKKILLV